MYFDTEDKVYKESEGPFKANGDSFINSTATSLSVDYITGYMYPSIAEDTPTTPLNISDVGDEVTTPVIVNANSSPLYSPLSTNISYYDIYVVADEGASIYINGVLGELRDASGALITEDVTPNTIVNDEYIGKTTLSLSTGLNTFNITMKDSSGNESSVLTIVINKQTSFIEETVHLINKDLVTNDGDYSVVIESTPGSSISLNGLEILWYSNGLDKVEGELSTTGVNDILIEVVPPTGAPCRPLLTHILYDSIAIPWSIHCSKKSGIFKGGE